MLKVQAELDMVNGIVKLGMLKCIAELSMLNGRPKISWHAEE